MMHYFFRFNYYSELFKSCYHLFIFTKYGKRNNISSLYQKLQVKKKLLFLLLWELQIAAYINVDYLIVFKF